MRLLSPKIVLERRLAPGQTIMRNRARRPTSGHIDAISHPCRDLLRRPNGRSPKLDRL